MALNKRVAIYAGTFDPMTLGHEDLVRRAVNLFDHEVFYIMLLNILHGFLENLALLAF